MGWRDWRAVTASGRCAAGRSARAAGLDCPRHRKHLQSSLLQAPDGWTLKGVCDQAILAVLLYHGLRREEAAHLTTSDLQDRRGIKNLQGRGKGGKTRYLPLHPVSAERIHAYLGEPGPGPLFRSIRGRTTGTGICPDGIYKVVAQWAKAADIHIEGLGVHGLRATTAANALEHVEGGGP